MADRRRPVLIELDAAPAAPPQDAPPVPEVFGPVYAPDAAAHGRAMSGAIAFAAGRVSWLARVFWGAIVALLGVVISTATWNFITGLIGQFPTLGLIALGLGTVALFALLAICVREASALLRLRRLDSLHQEAQSALVTGELTRARVVANRVSALYRSRAEMRLARAEFARRREDAFDTETVFAVAEDTLLKDLDARAVAEIEAAARQVATVTALVPLALADVVAALTVNIRMIRRLGEIYGGRSGAFGAWRLTRAVLSHLVATGAVAVGDDLLGAALGGSVLSKLSRRFGEGVVNGALTARVGVAAIEVCRPLPFSPGRKPSVTALMRRALTGLLPRGADKAAQ